MANEEDAKKNPDRGLDTAATSSMDIQSLNNVVVSLRGLMKKVQLFTIQKLVRQSKQLRSKKGTVENEKKKKKAERLVQEVGSIKDVKIDHAIKYALGNTKTFEEVAGKGDLDTRAKVRLATHPLMVEKVKSWRDEHEDWKALAAFVLYKNTGRRYKKKKKKDKESKSTEESTSLETPAKLSKTTKSKSKDEEEKESTPSRRKLVVEKIGDGESAKELARRAKTARNRQNHSQAEQVVDDASKSTDPSRAPVAQTVMRAESSGKGEEDNTSGSSEEDDSSMETEEKVGDEKDDSSVETEEKADDEPDDSNEEDESETKETEHRKEDVKSSTKDADDSENESSEEESDSEESDKEDSDEDEDDTKVQTKSTKQTEVSSKEVTKPVKLKPKPKPIGYKAGKDMAIKKIDLTSLSEDVEDIPVESDVSFLFTASKADDIPKPKPKKKDAFFAMDSDEEEGENDKEEAAKETTNDRRGRQDVVSYDNDVGMQRKLHHKKIESAFIGRLSDKQAKGDWGYGKGSFSRAPAEDQGPWGRGRGRGGASSSRGSSSGQGGFNQGAHRGQRGGYGQGRGGGLSGSMGSTGPTQRDQPANTMDHGTQDGKLHPSWEAKRKRKEVESKIAEFKGKKIKFDD